MAPRVPAIYRAQSAVYSELWRALSGGRADLQCSSGVDGQPGRQQAHGQAAANAVDPTRSTPAAPDPDSGARRPVVNDVSAVVSGATSAGRERYRRVAPEMLWSRAYAPP